MMKKFMVLGEGAASGVKEIFSNRKREIALLERMNSMLAEHNTFISERLLLEEDRLRTVRQQLDDRLELNKKIEKLEEDLSPIMGYESPTAKGKRLSAASFIAMQEQLKKNLENG